MYRVRIVGTGWSGGPSLNTLYFTAGSYSAEGALAVCTYVRAQWHATLTNNVPSFVTQNVSGEVDQIDPSSGEIMNTFSTEPTAGMPGTGTNHSAPIVTAILLRLNTSLFISGRRLRGRMFLSPVDNERVALDGTVTTAAVDYAQAFFPALRDALPTGTAWVVWHRPVGGTGGTAAAVEGVACNRTFAELRSRRD